MNKIYDIAIIGAGINGICIAKNLDKNKYQICLIETGGVENLSNLHDYKITGHPEGIKTVNDYKFGGGHNVWHGLLARLSSDEIDENIWCETPEKMDQYYDQAEHYLGLDQKVKKENERLILNDLKKSNLAELEYKIFHQVDVNFNQYDELNKIKISGVHVFLNHSVVSLQGDSENNGCYRVNSLNNIPIFARKIILSSNAIYNSIILMRSNEIKFENKNVGKFLSDHPMGVIAKIKFKNKHRFPICLIRKKYNLNFAKIGFSIKDEELDLLHTFYMVPTLEKKFNQANTTIRKSLIKIRDSGLSFSLVMDIIKNIDMILFVISYKFGLMFKTKYADLLVVSEQNLSENNKVTLNENQEVVKNWTIDDKLLESIANSAKQFSKLINSKYSVDSINILPKVNMMHELTSAAHLCCTTKMKNKSTDGVVDGNLELVGVKNIFVAGASVFPIAMSLNNTLTALALTFKLINKLNSDN